MGGLCHDRIGRVGEGPALLTFVMAQTRHELAVLYRNHKLPPEFKSKERSQIKNGGAVRI